MTSITKELVERLLSVVDAGLVAGLGIPIPGQMCVQAAVSYVLEQPHGDEPTCVEESLSEMIITLTDSPRWSSRASRARGLRRLAIAQLGTAGVLDSEAFGRQCAILATRTVVPIALRAAATLQYNPERRDALLASASQCEEQPSKESADAAAKAARVAYAARTDAAAEATSDAAHAAYAARNATFAAARAAGNTAAHAANAAAKAAHAATYATDAGDKVLADFCEGVVQILIAMKSPGTQWLFLTEAL